jgi:hypothetical protein
MTIDELARMVSDMKVELKADIAELKVYRETEASRCPYREEIGRASNNNRRLADIEKAVTTLRVDFARQAGIGGSAGGIIAAALMILGKALGWW